MRIFLIFLTIGLLGLSVLTLLPEPAETIAEKEISNFPVEKVNNNIRNVTPDNTLPGPKVDKTVISRLPNKAIPAPPKPKQKPVIWQNLIVSAAGLIQVNGAIFHIQGIKPLLLNATCSTDKGNDWPCGKFARTAMRGLVRNHLLKCEITDSHKRVAKCLAGNRDIGAWLVEQGWAKNHNGGYEEVMKTAKRAKKGMWGNAAP